ncbi:MAG: sugar transferase [Ilumatobacter sp.]|nr:sugar transferase [Ilumatobacter sp.]
MTRTSDAEPDGAQQPFPEAVERAIGRVSRPLNWMWDRGFRFLFVLDAIGLFASMIAINLVRFGWTWPTYPRSHYWVGFAIATGIHLSVNYFAGLYEREPRLGYRPWLPRIAVATGIAVALDGLAAVLTDRYLMPRLNLGLLLVVASLWLTANRTVSRYFANRRMGPSRILLVGHGEAVELAQRHFSSRERHASVVGTLERTTELFDKVNASAATDVLLLDISAFAAAFPEPLTALDREGVGVHQRVSARETLLGLQAVREIAGMPFTRMRTHAMASHQLRLKRLFDLAVIALAAPILVPTMVALAIYVRVVAGSPVLFRQTRVGFRGRRFEVVKFRTMVPDAEAQGAQLSARADGRVLPGLRWMRATRADELPQLWNVLRGEMSLVGPRPERPEMIQTFEQDVAGYARRHELPPGITGFAQINGRYETDAAFKLGYDLQYLVNWSIVLDVQILLRTVWVVVSRRV